MNALLKKREVAYYLRDSGAKMLFAWADFGARRRRVPRTPAPS